MVLIKKKCQGILPTNISASLVNLNSFVSGVYLYYIADMKYQLHHLHLERDFIQQKMIKIADIYINITVSILQLIYIIWSIKIANIQCWLILSTTKFQLSTFNKKIAEMYVNTTCICKPFIYYFLFGSNTQH